MEPLIILMIVFVAALAAFVHSLYYITAYSKDDSGFLINVMLFGMLGELGIAAYLNFFYEIATNLTSYYLAAGMIIVAINELANLVGWYMNDLRIELQLKRISGI